MELVQNWLVPKALFVFDLEFIGDVRDISTCRIWEIAIFSLTTNSWFEAIVDPDPLLKTFPAPPIDEIPQLTRKFLKEKSAQVWPVVFKQLVRWIDVQRMGATPILISHNTFRADKPIIELECRRYNLRAPLNWYFFDSLHFSRRVLKNTTGNYSLSGLHEMLFQSCIQNAHRAKADVVACMKILSRITNGQMLLEGPVYPSYCTALRTIRWIGQKAEELFYMNNVRSVEQLYSMLQTNARLDMISEGLMYNASVQKTLTAILMDQLPADNIRNISSVITETPHMLSYTFMA